MFDDLKDVPDVEEEKDSLGGGGFGPLETSIQDLTIEHAFGEISRNGAKALVIHAKNADGHQVRTKLWVINRKGKQYTEKDGNRRYTKGYNQANAICLLTTGKELKAMKWEKKTIELYDFVAKGMEHTPVQMCMDLIGKTFTVGLLKQIVDINENQGSQDKPNYQPSGYTREENEFDKIFCAKEGKNYGLTVVQIRAKETEPTFKEAWIEKNDGKTRDRSKAKKGHIPKPKNGESSSAGNTASDAEAKAEAENDADPLFD